MSGFIFISGDVFFGEIVCFDCGFKYLVYDIVLSGLRSCGGKDYIYIYNCFGIRWLVYVLNYVYWKLCCVIDYCVYDNIFLYLILLSFIIFVFNNV